MDGRHRAIVGRRTELDEIDRLLEHGGDSAAAVLLDGEAGIGETTIRLAGPALAVMHPAVGRIDIVPAHVGSGRLRRHESTAPAR